MATTTINGYWMKNSNYRTSRCILMSGDEFLMVVHNNLRGVNDGIWGLPGGRIEWGEKPVEAARREIYEELTIDLEELHDVGSWSYKGYQHKIFGSVFAGEVGRIDYNEILEIDWFTLDDIRKLANRNSLHAGFELESVEQFMEILAGLTKV
jgi:8-oxo-dGTP pyrophosphatase MutT (NUDIX family)